MITWQDHSLYIVKNTNLCILKLKTESNIDIQVCVMRSVNMQMNNMMSTLLSLITSVAINFTLVPSLLITLVRPQSSSEGKIRQNTVLSQGNVAKHRAQCQKMLTIKTFTYLLLNYIYFSSLKASLNLNIIRQSTISKGWDAVSWNCRYGVVLMSFTQALVSKDMRT